MRNFFFGSFLLFIFSSTATAQNTGIGTANPQAKLHVNGDLKLQQGVAINKFSADSTFAEASHSNIPTEKAIKDYFQKGFFTGADLYEPGVAAPFPRNYIENNTARSVSVQGNYAYVVSGTDQGMNGLLTIYDISNPDNIVAKDFIATNGAQSVFVQGNYAYVCSYYGRLSIYDISNPLDIIARGFIETNLDNAKGVFIQGSYAYVASYANNRLCIYDITNPDAIAVKGYTETNLDGPFSLYLKGNYAYVVNLNSNGNEWLSIFDVSNPDVIIAKAFTDVNLNGPCGIQVQDHYAYVANFFNSRLAIFDISNPDNILAKDFIDVPGVNGNSSVYVRGNYAFIASGGSNNSRLSVFMIGNPDDIISKNFTSVNLNTPRSVFVQGNYAYVTSYGNNRFCILDLDLNKTIEIAPGGLTFNSLLWRNSDTDPGKIYTIKNVGIGIANPNAPVSFSAAPGKKIILYQNSNNEIGMSVETLGTVLQIYTGNPGQRIRFGYEMGNAFTERMSINGTGNVITVDGGAYCTGTSWNNASDRSIKENINPVDGNDILKKISMLPISRWNYKTDPASVTHIGPMAQDFQAIFNTGTDNKTISTIDPSGIALAGIQALQKKIESLEQKIIELEKILANKNSPFIR